MAQLGAQRRLLIHLYHHHRGGLMRRPDSLCAIRTLRRQFADSPTPPLAGSGLGPATSDLLAAMTDEAIFELLQQVERDVHDRKPCNGAGLSPRPPGRLRRLLQLKPA